MRVCSVDGCNNKHLQQGLCNKHYMKLRKYGDPLAGVEYGVFKECSMDGCAEKVKAKDLCKKHYARLCRHGDPDIKLRNPNGEGTVDRDGYVVFNTNNAPKRAHILIAEKALGKPLPKGAVVHHIDCNKLNNANNNLVICPDRAYHNLIHLKQRALNECGNADYRKCVLCGKWDDINNYPKNVFRHKECHKKYERLRKSTAAGINI